MVRSFAQFRDCFPLVERTARANSMAHQNVLRPLWGCSIGLARGIPFN